MSNTLAAIVKMDFYPLQDPKFVIASKKTLDDTGVLVLPSFLQSNAIEGVLKEGIKKQHLAYYTDNDHNIYLDHTDPEYSATHPRNRRVRSSKGCITTDQIPDGSVLKTLYYSPIFRHFLCTVLSEKELYPYADKLSSINLNYAGKGQELGWHFDNSSFATTLMIQNPESAGVFEYVKDVRNADAGELNYEQVGKILDGDVTVKTLSMEAGTLALFRGRNSMHRVTPVEGNKTRILAVLAYNSSPGISLSESARKTFYGRI